MRVLDTIASTVLVRVFVQMHLSLLKSHLIELIDSWSFLSFGTNRNAWIFAQFCAVRRRAIPKTFLYDTATCGLCYSQHTWVHCLIHIHIHRRLHKKCFFQTGLNICVEVYGVVIWFFVFRILILQLSPLSQNISILVVTSI